jgi:hypothetical protein
MTKRIIHLYIVISPGHGWQCVAGAEFLDQYVRVCAQTSGSSFADAFLKHSLHCTSPESPDLPSVQFVNAHQLQTAQSAKSVTTVTSGKPPYDDTGTCRGDRVQRSPQQTGDTHAHPLILARLRCDCSDHLHLAGARKCVRVRSPALYPYLVPLRVCEPSW